MTSCFYNQPTCSATLTREHVISASVLKAVFGDPVRNYVSAEFLGAKRLVDHEAVVRDVCRTCNNERLPPYDSAGQNIIKQLIPANDPTGLRLLLSRESIGWLLKTHLNYTRVIKDRETREAYPIAQQIKSALIQHSELPYSLFRLFIEGWAGEKHFWDADDPRNIPWFNYRSVRFRRQRIVISELRIKTLVTWIVIPSDANYDGFEERVDSTINEVRRDFGFYLQSVDTRLCISDGYVNLTHVLPPEAVKRFIYPITNRA